MSRRWVVNASPIITLTKIGRIELLSQLCDELVIPQGVVDEIEYGAHDDLAVLWINDSGATYVRDNPVIDPRVATWDLGFGESLVLSWSIRHPGYEAIIDDRAARKAAAILQLPVRGTVSVLAIAQRQGYITSAHDEYEKLRDLGFRVSPAVIEKVLNLLEGN